MSGGKKTSLCKRAKGAAKYFCLKIMAFSLMMAFGTNAVALPVGGVVAEGGASISSTAGSTTITQSSQNVAINWLSFSIGQGEAVQFVQPNSDSVALNRVLGPDPSSILGSMTANGKVFLINPNGVLFARGAQINVGGLVASTLNISDADFMAGRYKFAGNSGAAILNQGTINADGGYVALLGATVSNDGIIVARLGTVALAAGNAITLDVAGDGLLNVTVNQGAVNALVENGGLIQADGGQVLLTALAAGTLLQSAVNNTGVIQAQTIENRNGIIRLLGGESSAVIVGGTLDASGTGAGQTGGSVTVTGQHVGLVGAKIDASGDAGGGGVLIGGDYQGKNPLVQNAARTYVSPDVVISADAITQGDGGKVIVWADDFTRYQGNISARGGAQKGNGGFAEVSGRNGLVFGGHVDLRAPGGRSGTLLLDPNNITIQDAGPDVAGNSTGLDLNSAVSTPNIFFADYGVLNSIITTAQVVTQLGAANVTLQATNDITVAAAIDAGGNAAGNALTLQAGHDVIINAALTAASGGGGSFILSAGRNVTVGAAITANNGSVTLSAGNNGTGPGVAAGTVTFAAVTAANLSIRFNPVDYTTTSAEIAAYAPKAALTGTFDARAWTFVDNASATAQSKTYDGTTVAALDNPFTFLAGPDGFTAGQIVSLSAGSANFNSAHVATATTVSFTGYGLGAGGDSAMYALFAQPASQLKTITAALLTVTANNQSKTYGTEVTLDGSEFSTSALQNSETIGSVTLTTLGTPATAHVVGSPYLITPSAAVGGSFTASDYTLTYSAAPIGFTVNPAPLTVVLSPVTSPVVVPPVTSPVVVLPVVESLSMLTVELTEVPAQLLGIMPVALLAAAPAEMPAVAQDPKPIIVPAQMTQKMYVAPLRFPKQDRN
jgi:filamentous hemagglutinin family protein